MPAIYRDTTESGYDEMNSYLRQTRDFTPEQAARIQTDVDNTVSGLGKLPQGGHPLLVGGGAVKREIEMFSDEWWALSPEDRLERTRAWEARRVQEIEDVEGPRSPGGLGLRKARVPVASEVTGRLRPDGTIEPVGPAADRARAARGRHDHRDRPENP